MVQVIRWIKQRWLLILFAYLLIDSIVISGILIHSLVTDIHRLEGSIIEYQQSEIIYQNAINSALKMLKDK